MDEITTQLKKMLLSQNTVFQVCMYVPMSYVCNVNALYKMAKLIIFISY